MKILKFILLFFVLCPCSLAHSEGFYFSSKAGASFLPDTEFDNGFFTTSHKIGFHAGGALGYQWTKNFRGEIETLYQQNGVKAFSVNGLNLPADGRIKLFNFLVNGYWDFMNDSPLVPYVMGGIGYSALVLDDVISRSGIFLSGTDEVVVYQLGAGLAYVLSENIDITFDYRLIRTLISEFEDGAGSEGDTKIFSHNIGIGARFYFSPKSNTEHSSKRTLKRKRTAHSQKNQETSKINAVSTLASNEPGIKKNPRLLIFKKKCASATNSQNFPPYSSDFLDCMKVSGWTKKK